ncbi:hypothetical protein PRIPAC_95965 [Pristionchus pacificus]|uniref:Uncharacterized protein n=1 Tax=Pristionchus pacificus TaxID=54126 RepID=A0A2A6D0A9_PRIPA|nr:hypothetical protein PRIPAC_95965 [Pristionchus pacificus]|eukprot:PDM83914.1 hypothetical protein PRIPAC_34106 [Pristionchus pacificus]
MSSGDYRWNTEFENDGLFLRCVVPGCPSKRSDLLIGGNGRKKAECDLPYELTKLSEMIVNMNGIHNCAYLCLVLELITPFHVLDKWANWMYSKYEFIKSFEADFYVCTRHFPPSMADQFIPFPILAIGKTAHEIRSITNFYGVDRLLPPDLDAMDLNTLNNSRQFIRFPFLSGLRWLPPNFPKYHCTRAIGDELADFFGDIFSKTLCEDDQGYRVDNRKRSLANGVICKEEIKREIKEEI